MTPAHMTASAEILELLLTAGADFTIVDENERSPLFVACAMNRTRTADYLIGCLDLQNDKALLKRDKRGDTPLHAGIML
jgi:ankyrin repeat protein